MIIAIDGLAGSGKSSTAKKVANKIGFNYFSTGKMYRSITCYCIEKGLLSSLPDSISNRIDNLEINFEKDNFNKILIDKNDYNENIYSKEVNKYVSIVSSIEKVRTRMVQLQRSAGKNNNIVCEGRDIGTIVFPDADYKFFFKADIKSRVDRRYIDMKSKGISITKEKLKDMIKSRDYKDMNRKISPLKRAKDATLVITTNMTMEEQIAFIVNKIKNKNKV
tara:strand:- start:267 stop:929 length:663 start_codon:yes stop_codon:yes gene_type:complete